MDRDSRVVLTRWLLWAITALAIISLTACDSRGRAYEDLRLARLTEGESTEQDVRKIFGEPAAVRDLADGKGLVYPLGPEGPHTLLLKLDARGTYRGREDLLARKNLDRISRGMKEVDVLIALGRPARAQRYPLKRQAAWEWRILDGGQTRIFVVTFDENGSVMSTSIEEDASRYGGK